MARAGLLFACAIGCADAGPGDGSAENGSGGSGVAGGLFGGMPTEPNPEGGGGSSAGEGGTAGGDGGRCAAVPASVEPRPGLRRRRV